MNSGTNEGIYPLHRSKTVHLVRHAQGVHNVAGEKDHSAYMSEELFDAHLTPLGWEQVDNLRKHVHASGLFKNIELVVVSPLLRTMQTAVGAFGGEATAVGIDGIHPCDRRRSISEYKSMFPAIDFSLIETDHDVWWSPKTREKPEDVAARGLKFMKWLLTREEKEIVVVSHGGFLIHTLRAYGDDCHPTPKKEMSIFFNNCELRSMVIVDRSMIGSDTSKTDFPRKIPGNAVLASDAD
ncbi:putative histidine phosphatase superfamily, clade-1 [Helianthus annuus]|nr:putative histidine phosphatase superfamily, clade-1 [Helianthus annuus]